MPHLIREGPICKLFTVAPATNCRYELVPSSLEELERMVEEGVQIFPRRITATFDGEEA
jgi:hypothetical protein